MLAHSQFLSLSLLMSSKKVRLCAYLITSILIYMVFKKTYEVSQSEEYYGKRILPHIIETDEDYKDYYDMDVAAADADEGSGNTNEEAKRPYNIFFVQTNDVREKFSIRELCSIESAAKHNPNARVMVKSLKAKISVNKILKTYPNIEWSIIKLNEIFNDTPLYDWWRSGKLASHNSYFRYSHLSDALRHTLIFKYGGLYSDLDVIALKSNQL